MSRYGRVLYILPQGPNGPSLAVLLTDANYLKINLDLKSIDSLHFEATLESFQRNREFTRIERFLLPL